jgi:tetratricopeptide (TPR) repeat protein
VEIHENYQATGLKFEIQSKGHERLRIVHSDMIAQPLKVSTLNYFDRSLLPVLLVVYSAQDEKAYYLWVKTYIQEVLNKERPDWRERDGQSEITLHVPLTNVFDETAHQDILSHVETETAKLAMRGGTTFSPPFYRRKFAVSRVATSSRLIQPKITNYLHRPRLTDKLASALAKQSVFLHTDAGYGKTWLIHNFIATTNPSFIWYTFNKDLVSAMQFIEELASEVLRQTNDGGARTLAYLHGRGRDARPDEAIAILIEEIQSSDFQLLLVIEDMQYISDNAVNSTIESLLISRPSTLQIILTSRFPLPFGQARLIAQGLLTVIERPEIAFSLDETREYLERNLKLTLSQEQTQYLQERTGGWIAAVGLAADALQETSLDKIDVLFERLTGFDGNIYDFFAEEVYASLDAETGWLLKRLGLVSTIQPEIVDLFTQRTDGGQVLRDLTKRNTFLIEDDSRVKSYRFHSLFAEFLETRFQDEEGIEAVKIAHSRVAHYYSEYHDWYPATQHAIEAKEYELAVQGLETIAPAGVNMGYSKAVLAMVEQVPAERLDQSAPLQEVIGRAALQTSELNLALDAFKKAQKLYQAERDETALNRLQYFIAEVGLESGDMPPEVFVRTAHRVALNSYKQNDVFFGAQVELRLIEVGQTLTVRFKGFPGELIERSEALLARIEQFGDEYALIKARVLAAQAHLLVQVVSFAFPQEASKVHMRLRTGHPVPEEERIAYARALIEGLQHISELYTEAESIAKEESEIEWARIRLQRVNDHAHQMSMFQLVGAKLGAIQDPLLIETFETQKEDMIRNFLPMLHGCAQIFAKYHMVHDLAITYCDAADIYDILGDLENRDRLAQEALDLAENRGMAKIAERAQKLLKDQFTFSSLREPLDQGPSDKDLASLDEEGKAQFVGSLLRAYAGDTNVEEMRKAIEADVDDIVAAAKQRVEWCRHVQIIQDLQHTRSLATMYRTIPKKRIVCIELGHESPYEGYSFDELWAMFRGVYCLGCPSRSLAE